MARVRNPSGLPSDRIVGPVYGPREVSAEQLYRQVGHRHEGMLRVRRTFLVATILVGTLTLLVAIFGSTRSASGIATIWLAPLVFFLIVVHLIAICTRPKVSADTADEA